MKVYRRSNNKKNGILRRSLSFILIIVLMLGLTSITSANAEEKALETAKIISEELSNFDNTLEDNPIYGIICNSYLNKTDNGYQTVLVDEKIHIFDYDSNWNLLSESTLDYELPIFGGYYSGVKYNYMVFGQTGSSNGTEIYRIVKYDKNFDRISALSVPYEDCYTNIPFENGNVSIAETGDKLTIYTSRKRPDLHQSNIAIRINTDKMEIDNKYGMISFPDIHVSHSLRQIVKYDGDTPIYVDLGDAYPRAVCLQEQPGKQTIMLNVSGQSGDNVTGTDVSGMEITKNGYLVVGTQERNYCNNIYLSYAEKGADTAHVIWLTNSTIYNYSNVCNARIVKISTDIYAVMWNCYDGGSHVNYVMLNGNGDIISELKTLYDAEITQCEPILADGKVIWFKYSGGKQEVYSIEDFECKGTYEINDTYVSAVNPWDGNVDTGWYNDKQTEFTINTSQELAGLAELVNNGKTFEGKTVLLGKDLFLNEEDSIKNVWTPIALESSGISFEGTFDGQGHSLYNLYTTLDNGIGLFGIIGEKGIVKALSISQSVLEGASIAYQNNGWILFCENKSMIYYHTSVPYVGGICCKNTNLIYGCGNRGSVEGSDAGGIVGLNMGNTASIDSCWNQGYVSATGFCSAGIVSSNYGYVYDCYNAGTVSGNVMVNYAKTVAGIVGGNHGNGSVRRCYNTGHLDINDEWNWYRSDAICGEGSSSCIDIYSTPSKYNKHAVEISISDIRAKEVNEIFKNKGIAKWCKDECNLNGGCIIPVAQQDMNNRIYKMLPDIWNPVREVSIYLADKEYQLKAFSGAYYGIKDAKAVYSSSSDTLSISQDGIITPLSSGTAIVEVLFEETAHTKEVNYDVKVTIENIIGDANTDGKVDIKDSAIIKRYLAGWDVEINMTAADMDEDGKVTIKDSALIKRQLAG